MDYKLRRPVLFATALLFGSIPSLGQAAGEQRYWIMLSRENGPWCGYTNESLFKRDMQKVGPTETARIVAAEKKVAKITYQISAESGDWIVLDKYSSTATGFYLSRSFLMSNYDAKVTQDIEILRGDVRRGRQTATDLEGKKPKKFDEVLPDIEIAKKLSDFPFYKALQKLLENPVAKVCS